MVTSTVVNNTVKRVRFIAYMPPVIVNRSLVPRYGIEKTRPAIANRDELRTAPPPPGPAGLIASSPVATLVSSTVSPPPRESAAAGSVETEASPPTLSACAPSLDGGTSEGEPHPAINPIVRMAAPASSRRTVDSVRVVGGPTPLDERLRADDMETSFKGESQQGEWDIGIICRCSAELRSRSENTSTYEPACWILRNLRQEKSRTKKKREEFVP